MMVTTYECATYFTPLLLNREETNVILYNLRIQTILPNLESTISGALRCDRYLQEYFLVVIRDAKLEPNRRF